MQEGQDAFGMTAEDYGVDHEVWPDNWAAFRIFDAMRTQWREGFGGRSGLDYSALPAVMSYLGIPKKLRAHVFQDLRVMEAEALLVMSESK